MCSDITKEGGNTMKYKMVCLDMDGTLLTDDKKITERSHETLRKVQQKGVKVVVCTGRLFTSANCYADLLGVKTAVITSNGAYIREKDKNKVVYESILDIEKCRIFVNIAKKYEACIYFNTTDCIVSDTSERYVGFYQKYNKTLSPDKQINIDIIKDWNEIFDKYRGRFVKCIIADENSKKLDIMRKEISSVLSVEIVSSGRDNIEIMNKGVSKGRGALILGDYYGIPRDDIICIGDNENDVSMIDAAGLGIAMENGDEKAKAAADYITDTNNNDGVAKALEKFVLGTLK